MSYKYVAVHRLVALAWIKNRQDNFVFRPIVNHIDGNKGNYHFKNLEWCSFKENNNHAADTGLSKEHIKCSIRDFRTGVVRKFRSLSEAEQFMGVNPGTIRTNKVYVRKAKLYCNKYEFKLDSDKSPWFYEGRTERVKVGRYIIEVTDNDNKTEYYYDTRDFKRKFKLWNCPGMKVMLERAKAENLGYTFKVHDNYNSKPIQAFNIETSEVLETKSIASMSTKLNIPEHSVRYCLNGDERWVKGRYAFRYKSDKPWNKNFIDKNIGKGNKLKVTNITSKEVLLFDSIRQAARHFGTSDRYWLRQCIKQKIPYGGWLFELLDEKNGFTN